MTKPNLIYIIGEKNSGKSSLLFGKQNNNPNKVDIFSDQYQSENIRLFESIGKKLTITRLCSEYLSYSDGENDFLENHFSNCSGIIITADLSKPINDKLLKMCQANAPTGVKIILVGTKSDLGRKHHHLALKQLAENANIECVITSAKTGGNITVPLEMMLLHEYLGNTLDFNEERFLTYDSDSDDSDDDDCIEQTSKEPDIKFSIPKKLAKQLEYETAEVSEQIKRETHAMQIKLANLFLQKDQIGIEKYTNEVQDILHSYKKKCDEHAGHDDTLTKIIHATIIAITCGLLGIILATSVCSTMGILGVAAVGCTIGGYITGSSIGYTASALGFFIPNTLQRAVNNAAYETRKTDFSSLRCSQDQYDFF